MTRYVYLASSPYLPRMTKIGQSAAPNRRVAELRIGCPGLSIRARYPITSTMSESWAHEHFARVWVEGEWFRMDWKQIDRMIRDVQSGW